MDYKLNSRGLYLVQNYNKHQIVVQLKDIPCSTMPEKKERSNSKK